MAKARHRKKRVAVVGCGKIGALFEAEPKREKPASHAGAALRNPKTELVALIDADAGALAKAHKLFPRARAYHSFSACLSVEHPDIVVIATPPSARLSLIRACVQADVRTIICEKPLAMSLSEAKKIQILVKKSGMRFVLNYQRRFSPLFARVRANIAAGKFGRIQQVTCYYSNGLYNNGGHTINALAYLLRDKIVSVSAFVNKENATHPKGDANIDAMLTTKNGTRIVLQSLDQHAYGAHDFHIYGTKGSAIITDYGAELLETPAHPSRFVGVKQLEAKSTRRFRAPLSATKDALEEALSPGASASSVESGVAVLAVLDGLAKSAKRRGAVVAL